VAGAAILVMDAVFLLRRLRPDGGSQLRVWSEYAMIPDAVDPRGADQRNEFFDELARGGEDDVGGTIGPGPRQPEQEGAILFAAGEPVLRDGGPQDVSQDPRLSVKETDAKAGVPAGGGDRRRRSRPWRS
jgi:hypothetical protein